MRPLSKRDANFGTSIIREMFSLLKDPNTISFAGGEPAVELYPMEKFQEASAKALEEFGRTCLAYSATEGVDLLRDIIAKERMKAVGVTCTKDNIAVTNGSQQGIEFTAKMFIDEGDVIICEGPTYLASINAFNSYMGKTVQVPIDENGMIMEELEKALEAYPSAKFIYTIPDFQNPSGVCMSLERRKKLVEIAEKHDILVLEDNPYIELRFAGEKLPAVKSFDTKGYVVYLGSFSKIAVPGARIGWICADEKMIEAYGKIKQASDLQPNTITQYQLIKFMQLNDMDAHIESLAPFYKEKGERMLAAIEREFPEGTQYTKSQGGLFTWVTLPKHINASELFKQAVNNAVAFVPGQPFFAEPGNENYMRISYSKATLEQIDEGIARLGKLIKEYK